MPRNKPPATPFDGLGALDGGREQRSTSGKPSAHKYPVARTKLVLEAADDLELVLGIHGFTEGWREVLDGYRAAVVSGITNPHFYLRYQGCWAEIMLLVTALRNRENYDAADHMTSGVIRLVHSRKRAKSDGAEQVRKLFGKERYWSRPRDEQKVIMGRALKLAPKSTVYAIRAELLRSHPPARN